MVTSPTSSLTAAMLIILRTLVLTIITMCGPVYQVIMTSHSSLLTPDSTVNVDQRAAKQNTHPPSGHSIIRDERTGRPENPHFTFHSQKITSIERKHNHSTTPHLNTMYADVQIVHLDISFLAL